MTIEKFRSEIKILEKFFYRYCEDKHINQELKLYNFKYKDESFQTNISLCKDCQNLINYSFEKLNLCPHEEKPRCRKCPNPCYEKNEWKKLAKIMIYSSFIFNVSNLKNKLINFTFK